MENLLKELTNPRLVAPSQAQLRAAEVIKKLLESRERDLAARVNAERLLVDAHADVERLTKELKDAQETINKFINSGNTNADAGKPSVSEAKTSTDEVSGG